MTDPGGDIDDQRPPDLVQPPAYIEGAGGGPAFPVGSLSADEKENLEDFSGVLNMSAVALGAAGIIAITGGPAGLLVSGFLLGSATGFLIVSGVALTLANDPPQPNYTRPVQFRQRVSNPPQTMDPALEPLRVVIQQSVFASVTANGYLDAIERLQGAQQGEDLTWALVHRGVADLARQQLIVDIANNGAALFAAGNALKGSQFDLQLDPGLGGAKQWIEDKANQAAFASQLEASGFTRAEMKQAFAFFKSDPIYNGPSIMVSAQIIEAGETIHATAMKLFEMK